VFFGYKVWENLQVRDVVKVEKYNLFLANLLLLSSNIEGGIFMSKKTMSLD
jgi:hypothetical protein